MMIETAKAQGMIEEDENLDSDVDEDDFVDAIDSDEEV